MKPPHDVAINHGSRPSAEPSHAQPLHLLDIFHHVQRILPASVSITLALDMKWLHILSSSYGDQRKNFALLRGERHVHPKRDSFFVMWFLTWHQSPWHQALLEATPA